MRELQKWNVKKHVYEPYCIPDEWKILLTGDLEEKINCVQCGKEVKYRDTYTSLEVHTPTLGFGYPVCEECYEEEYQRRIDETRD